MENVKRKEYALFGINLVLCIALVILWFSPLNFHVFMGDDLRWIRIYHSDEFTSGSWSNVLTMGNNIGKFRPVTNALLLISTGVCQNNFDCFVAVNLIISILNVFLISLLAYFLSNRWWPSIFVSSIVFLLSRFSYYSVLQVMGEIENLAMTFTILYVYCMINFVRRPNNKWFVLSTLFFCLAFLSHERFIVLLAPLLLALILSRKELKTSRFVIYLATLMFLPVFYIVVKKTFFNSSFFTGTGGTNITDTFNISQFITFIFHGALNLIGFNAGPDYLSGKNFLSTGGIGIFLGVVLSSALLALALLCMIQKIITKKDMLISVVLLTIILSLITAGSVTIRQEYRWLYAPFAVFVLLASFVLSKIPSVKFRYILMLMITVSFISVDIYYRQFIFNVFFMDGLRTAGSVKTEIIDKYGASRLSQSDIYIIPDLSAIKQWYLYDKYFFSLYTGIPEIKVQYINALDQIPTQGLENKIPLAFQIKNTQVTEIPQKTIQKAISNNILLSGSYNTEYDFIENFSSGILSDNNSAETPTGQGAFLMNWQAYGYYAGETLTLVSPISIRYPSIVCKSGSSLMFQALIPFTASDGADLYIMLNSQGVSKQIAEIHIKPPIGSSLTSWGDFNLPLDDCSGKPIDITFGVASPSGNTAADWIAMANVRLVSPKQ